MRSRASELVPGTHQLAVVAAVDAVAKCRAQFLRYRTLQFDREVGNTAARIQAIGCDDGAGRAGGNACRTGAAMGAGGLINRQRRIGVDLSEKEPRACITSNQ